MFPDVIYQRVLTGEQEDADLTFLKGMYHAAGAGHLCADRKGCMKGTRRDILSQLESWLNDEQGKRVFWLNGLAGTGKTTIAQTFAEMAFADGKLGASFFCSRNFDSMSGLKTIFPTLAFQLAHQYHSFREQLLPVLKRDVDIEHQSLSSQIEMLIAKPFIATRIPTLIIIDALDECKDENPTSALLSILSHYVVKIPFVKFFITGRPEPQIRSGFCKHLQLHTEVLKLHDVEHSSVDADIKLYLKAQLSEIAKGRSDCDLAEVWPSPQDIDAVCKKAAGFFIYASTVVKFVASEHLPPGESLTYIVSHPDDTSHERRSGINLLYMQVLEQAFSVGDGEFCRHFKLVVGAVVLIFYPLSVRALSDLLRNCGTLLRVYSTLRVFTSLLLVPGKEKPVQIFHKSFPDFLMDPELCKDRDFFIDPSIYHTEVLLSCLSLIKEKLKRNVCQLEDYISLEDVEDLPTQRSIYIGDALGYACCFWASHLVKTPVSGPSFEEVDKAINEFFTTCFLFWIEVLSLMENLDRGVYALKDIHQWYMEVSYI